MRCPKCRNAELKETKVKNTATKVDHCPKCKGVWFDTRELEKVLSVATKELEVPSSAEQSAALSCPRCGSALFQFQYPQTYAEVDMCKNCGGLWLDAGEFKEIKAVRQMLEKSGKLDEYAMPAGAKGGLLRFIDAAISGLKPF